MWVQFVTVGLVSFFVTVLCVPLTILFAKKVKLMDDPKTHKHPAILHSKPIPRAGGLAIYIGIVAAALIFLPLDHFLQAILVGGLVVVITGLLDDKFDISPYLRFFLNILAAGIAVYAGVEVPLITNPLGGILQFTGWEFNVLNLFVLQMSDILAVIWIVWVMNMLNWSKGVDGQLPGIAAISAVVIGLASLRFATLGAVNITTSELSFIVAGASLGFLVFNFYPAKIFPGYSATILGYLLGILSITSGVKLATAVLVMGVPTVDALITIIRRLISKRSPFWHDRGHLHHLLLNYGMGHRSIAVFYWLMSLVLGVVALSASSRGKVFAIILVVVVVVIFISILRIAGKREEFE